jgi:hypothetical protein
MLFLLNNLKKGKNMSVKESLLASLKTSQVFFDNSTSCLTETDAGFTAAKGMFTVAQQVAHTSLTIDWFLEPLMSAKGFNMDFEKHEKEVRGIHSLSTARDMLSKSFETAFKLLEEKDDAFFLEALPKSPIMGGAPKCAVFSGIEEHTAHHRGA